MRQEKFTQQPVPRLWVWKCCIDDEHSLFCPEPDVFLSIPSLITACTKRCIVRSLFFASRFTSEYFRSSPIALSHSNLSAAIDWSAGPSLLAPSMIIDSGISSEWRKAHKRNNSAAALLARSIFSKASDQVVVTGSG